LHDRKLAFEIFGENGTPSGCSLVPAMLKSIGSDFESVKQTYNDLKNLGPEQAAIILQSSFIPVNLLPLLMTRLKRHVIKDQLWSDLCVISYNESSFVMIYRPLFSHISESVSEASENSDKIYIYTFGDPKARTFVINELLSLCKSSFSGINFQITLQYMGRRYGSQEIEDILMSEDRSTKVLDSYLTEDLLVGIELLLNFKNRSFFSRDSNCNNKKHFDAPSRLCSSSSSSSSSDAVSPFEGGDGEASPAVIADQSLTSATSPSSYSILSAFDSALARVDFVTGAISPSSLSMPSTDESRKKEE